MRRATLFLALACFSLPTLSSAAQGPGPRARLRVHATYAFGGHGFTQRDEEIFLTTSRLVTATKASSALSTNPLSEGWLADSLSKVARKNVYARLQQDLLANDIASQEGDCSVSVPVAPTTGSVVITWFDGGTRKDLRVELEGTAPRCPPEMVNIVNSIKLFAETVGIHFALFVE